MSSEDMQPISIRLPKKLIVDLKACAKENELKYQRLIRNILQEHVDVWKTEKYNDVLKENSELRCEIAKLKEKHQPAEVNILSNTEYIDMSSGPKIRRITRSLSELQDSSVIKTRVLELGNMYVELMSMSNIEADNVGCIDVLNTGDTVISLGTGKSALRIIPANTYSVPMYLLHRKGISLTTWLAANATERHSDVEAMYAKFKLYAEALIEELYN